ncbi:MAG: hypothetical protein HGB10_03845 [Coriobacteriia bacterium]|nr:hypothetical protein [Coriobacteriia bacterium]
MYRKPIVGFLLVLATLTALFASTGTIRNLHYKIESDGKYYYQFLVSAVGDGDLDFTDDYRAPRYPWMEQDVDHYLLRYELSPVSGRPSNPFSVGPAILWLPFALITKVAASILIAIGVRVDPSPWGRFFQYGVMWSAVVYGTAALWCLYRLTRRFVDPRAAAWATALALLATNLLYYVIFEPSMSHTYDVFAYSAFLLAFVTWSKQADPLRLGALGVLGGLCILVRTQNVITIALFSVLLGWLWLRRHEPRQAKSLLAYFAALAITASPVALVNTYLYGSPGTVPQGEGFLDWAHPYVWEVLFSGRNGLFSHHPILLVGLVGVLALIADRYRNRDYDTVAILAVMLLAFAGQAYVNSVTADWWAGDSFGQRRLLGSLPLFTIGLGFAAEKALRAAPRIAVTVFVASMLAGLYLTFIHVWLWPYDQPHNILAWMFIDGPRAAIARFGGRFGL